MSDDGGQAGGNSKNVLDTLANFLSQAKSRANFLFGFLFGASIIGYVHIATNVGDQYLVYSGSGVLLVIFAWAGFQMLRMGHVMRDEEFAEIQAGAEPQTELAVRAVLESRPDMTASQALAAVELVRRR